MAKIPEEVLDVLSQCRAEGNVLFLPDVQLDRKLYTEVNKVLEKMGGKWNRKEKGHVFSDGDPAEMLEVVLLTQEVRDLKKEFQFFPTPKPVIDRLCELAELDKIGPATVVMEPSCGDGRMVDAIMEHHPGGLVCFELNPGMAKYLDGKPYADLMWLPSATDMFGPSNGRWWNDEPDSFQLEIFKRERDRIKELDDKGTYPWWLRSVYSGGCGYFCFVSTDGSAGNYYAYFSIGFAPGFDIAAHDSE